MNLDRVFMVFAVVVGAVIGTVLILVPQSRTLSLPPYFWVLIAFALFEGFANLRRSAVMGPPITTRTRLIGFGIALALSMGIPMLAGVELSLI